MAPEDRIWAKQSQVFAQNKEDLSKNEGAWKLELLEVLEQKVDKYLFAVVRNWHVNPFHFNIPITLDLSSTQHRHFLYSMLRKWSPLANPFLSTC